MNEPQPKSVWKKSWDMDWPFKNFVRWLFSWRGVRRMLIVLAWSVTIIALLYGEENWRGRRAWNKYRQELEARGEQLDLKAFIPKPVPDEQNFAATPFIQSWFVRSTNTSDPVANKWNDNFEHAATKALFPATKLRSPISGQFKVGRHFFDLVGWGMAFDAIRSSKFDQHQRFESDKFDSESRGKGAPSVLEGLKSSEAHLAELRAASRRPYARYPVNYDLENPWGILLPHLANIKLACLRLQLRSCAELASGQSESALEDVRFMLYLTDSVKDEPFLISYLVRLACFHITIQTIWEGLAERRWSDAQLQELQARLQQYDFPADLKKPLDSERATGILSADLIRKKGLGLLVDLVGPGTPTPFDRSIANFFGRFIPSGWYNQEQLNYCRLYEAQLAGVFDPAKKTVSPRQTAANARELERLVAGGRLGKGFKAVIHHHVLAGQLLPALGKLPLKAAIAQVATDQAALACALERYRLANGKFPDKLEALAPRFLSRLPNDVISGEPYKYRQTDNGPSPSGSGPAGGQFLLYSIGWNEKDDDGKPGERLFGEEQGDWVWSCPAQE